MLTSIYLDSIAYRVLFVLDGSCHVERMAKGVMVLL
jgi:hypothetical protein